MPDKGKEGLKFHLFAGCSLGITPKQKMQIHHAKIQQDKEAVNLVCSRRNSAEYRCLKPNVNGKLMLEQFCKRWAVSGLIRPQSIRSPNCTKLSFPMLKVTKLLIYSQSIQASKWRCICIQQIPDYCEQAFPPFLCF